MTRAVDVSNRAAVEEAQGKVRTGYAVLYFGSDASSYCSGQTLWVNVGAKG